MAERIIVHCVEVEDKAGSLQALLAKAAEAGVDFQGFIASSCGGGGKGCVCMVAKNPAALAACAGDAGIEAKEMAGFIITGDDKVGAAANALKGLADAGISGVAGAAIVCDGQYYMIVVVESADGDAAADVI
ncbi:MAG: hypothetical protein ACYSRQ_03075 [Planctomycetota bacterium]|jgi:hypothetical protein